MARAKLNYARVERRKGEPTMLAVEIKSGKRVYGGYLPVLNIRPVVRRKR